MSETHPELMDLDEFRDGGYLMELNRRFLHPLGLALAVTFEDGHVAGIHGIWDYRKDAEGILYGADEFSAADRDRARAIEQLAASKVEARRAFGCDDNGIQPIPEREP